MIHTDKRFTQSFTQSLPWVSKLEQRVGVSKKRLLLLEKAANSTIKPILQCFMQESDPHQSKDLRLVFKRCLHLSHPVRPWGSCSTSFSMFSPSSRDFTTYFSCVLCLDCFCEVCDKVVIHLSKSIY